MHRAITSYAFHPAPIIADRLCWSDGLWTWRPEGTSDWLIMVCVEGSGQLEDKAGMHPVSSQEILLVPPSVPHNFGVATESWVMLWAHFLPPAHWSDLLGLWPRTAGGVHRFLCKQSTTWQGIESAAEAMVSAWTSGGEYRERLAMNALEHLLLITARESGHAASPASTVVRLTQSLLMGAPRTTALTDIARRAGLSYSRLAHLFEIETGLGMAEWREAHLMERARVRLLASAEPVKAIATDLGYDCPFYFTKRFHRVTGMSPSEYRKKA